MLLASLQLAGIGLLPRWTALVVPPLRACHVERGAAHGQRADDRSESGCGGAYMSGGSRAYGGMALEADGITSARYPSGTLRSRWPSRFCAKCQQFHARSMRHGQCSAALEPLGTSG